MAMYSITMNAPNSSKEAPRSLWYTRTAKLATQATTTGVSCRGWGSRIRPRLRFDTLNAVWRSARNEARKTTSSSLATSPGWNWIRTPASNFTHRREPFTSSP